MRAAATIVLGSCLLAGCSPPPRAAPPPPARSLGEFEGRLERLRLHLRIPALSAAIARGDRVVWSRAFGYADLENGVRAAPNTSFHLASLTKPFASTVLLKLLEEGKLDLEDPVSKYGIELQSSGVVRVKHLLTHTSQGEPGASYRYNGARFALLDKVITGASGRTFAELLVERIIAPLGLSHTAPNIRSPDDFRRTGLDPARFEANLARPYELDGEKRIVPSEYPSYFGAAAGLIASAPDVARFSIAIDDNLLLREETKARAFTPAVSTSGKTLPYGLGWFVEEHGGLKVIWHYGYWTANSSLIVKVPERKLTFVLLANSDMLSRPYDLGAGDLLVSPAAREFLDAFVLGGAALPDLGHHH